MLREPRRKVSKISKITNTNARFASVIHAYLNSPKFQTYAPNTRKLWGRMLRLAGREDILGAVSTEEIRPKLVQSFPDGLIHKPSTQRAARTALKRLEAWAIVRELLPIPLTPGTEVVEYDGGHQPWTSEQVRIAEQYARPDLAPVVTLAVNTGQRGSDLVNMHWLETYQRRSDIDVRQKKTKKRLQIPMTEEMQIAIANRVHRRMGTIIGRADGQPFERKELTDGAHEVKTDKALRPLKAAGVVLHGLRATAVVRPRRAGASEDKIWALVGMSIPRVHRYCRLADQRENAIAAVFRLDGTRRRNRKKAAGLSA